MANLLYSLVLVSLLILKIEATIYAWGVNDYGQLGLNETVARFPQRIAAYENKNIVELVASGTFHMAVADNGNVYVSGNNWYGGLGLPLRDDRGFERFYVPYPTENPQLRNCKIYLGKRHGNAVCNGKLYGWGVKQGYVVGRTRNENYGRINASLAHYQLGSNIVNITAGSRFSILALTNNSMVIVGDGDYGVLGLGDTQTHNTFVEFDAFKNIPLLKIFPSHADHVCAISQTFSLYCWGDNSVGQLGLGDTLNRTRPTLVSFFEEDHYIVQVATGLTHTLALTASGKVFAWGLAANGVLGNGKSDNSTSPTPYEITSLTGKGVVEIVAGLNFNYARTSSNQWYSWGAGHGGVLGTLNDNDKNKPEPVSFLSSFNINRILTASTSRSIYGWLDPAAPTAIIGGPALVNECLIKDQIVCKANAQCEDTDRRAICVCKPGFAGNPESCVDIDECKTNDHNCAPNATCTNLPGSFNCTCPPELPLGDGTKSGTGCYPIPPPPTTASSTTSGTTSGTTTGMADGSTTSSTTSSQSNTTSSTSSTSGTPGTTGATNTSGTPTTGTDGTTGGGGSTSENGGGSTTQGSSSPATTSTTSTGAASTNGRTNLYQTLFGAKDQIEKPNPTTGESDDLIVVGGGKSRDRDVMIGVLIAFGILMLIVIIVGAFLIFRSRRPIKK